MLAHLVLREFETFSNPQPSSASVCASLSPLYSYFRFARGRSPCQLQQPPGRRSTSSLWTAPTDAPCRAGPAAILSPPWSWTSSSWRRRARASSRWTRSQDGPCRAGVSRTSLLTTSQLPSTAPPFPPTPPSPAAGLRASRSSNLSAWSERGGRDIHIKMICAWTGSLDQPLLLFTLQLYNCAT